MSRARQPVPTYAVELRIVETVADPAVFIEACARAAGYASLSDLERQIERRRLPTNHPPCDVIVGLS